RHRAEYSRTAPRSDLDCRIQNREPLLAGRGTEAAYNPDRHRNRIRIWRQQKCNRMKLLVQGWSESTCKLYDFVLTEIGDNKGEVLRGFKSGYFHPAKVVCVDAESSGLGTR